MQAVKLIFLIFATPFCKLQKENNMLSVLALSEFRKSPISVWQPVIIQERSACAYCMCTITPYVNSSPFYTISSVGLCVLLRCRVWGYF